MRPQPTHDPAEAKALFVSLAGPYAVSIGPDGLPRVEGRKGRIEFAGDAIATIHTSSEETYARLLFAGARRRHRTTEKGYRVTIKATRDSIATFASIIDARLAPRMAA